MDAQANTVTVRKGWKCEFVRHKTSSNIISELISITSKNLDIQGITIQVAKAVVNHIPPLCQFTRPYLDIYAYISSLFDISPTNHSKWISSLTHSSNLTARKNSMELKTARVAEKQIFISSSPIKHHRNTDKTRFWESWRELLQGHNSNHLLPSTHSSGQNLWNSLLVFSKVAPAPPAG